MGRIIVATGLGGIAVITALAWRLASARIAALCYVPGQSCLNEMQVQKDRIILIGLSVALAYVLLSLIAYAILRARQGETPIRSVNGWRSTSRGRQALPR